MAKPTQNSNTYGFFFRQALSGVDIPYSRQGYKYISSSSFLKITVKIWHQNELLPCKSKSLGQASVLQQCLMSITVFQALKRKIWPKRFLLEERFLLEAMHLAQRHCTIFTVCLELAVKTLAKWVGSKFTSHCGDVGIGFGSYDHTTEHLLTKSWKRLQPPDLAMCGKVNVAL